MMMINRPTKYCATKLILLVCNKPVKPNVKPDVSFEFVSGNIRTLGKTRLFPSGSDIKCIIFNVQVFRFGLFPVGV